MPHNATWRPVTPGCDSTLLCQKACLSRKYSLEKVLGDALPFQLPRVPATSLIYGGECCMHAGPPQLMMAFTQDGQLKPELVADRDRRYGKVRAPAHVYALFFP